MISFCPNFLGESESSAHLLVAESIIKLDKILHESGFHMNIKVMVWLVSMGKSMYLYLRSKFGTYSNI